MSFDIPILFLVFNRPHETKTVFEAIKKRCPAKLFIAADGARENKIGEDTVCLELREWLISNIDWDCEIHTLFRKENLGCGKAVSSAITWFFENVDLGIILEDDCLPNDSFFSFCQTMLEYYRDDERIMHISANNFQQGKVRGDGSYYFSRLTHIWGWATWRRAWQKYDFTLKEYKYSSTKGLNLELKRHFKMVKQNAIDTWDIQWFMTVWFNNGITIMPQLNLVKNIGYGGVNATHTKRPPKEWFKKMTHGLIKDLKHPSDFQQNKEADVFTFNTVYKTNYIKNILKTIVENWFRM